MNQNFMPTVQLKNGEIIGLTEAGLKIGSMAAVCDIVLSEPDVSPVHCEIVKSDDGWAVHELHSDIGILLNGKEVPKGKAAALHGGDRITIGSEILTFNERTTVFTDEELADLNAVMGKLSRGDTVERAAAEKAVGLLDDKAQMLAEACGISSEAAKKPLETPPPPEQTVDSMSSAEQRSSLSNRELVGAFFGKQPVDEREKTAGKPAAKTAEANSFQFNSEKVTDTHLPTLCFLTPTDETAERFGSRAICVKQLPFNIGADPRNDYVIDDSSTISAVHAQIVKNTGGGYALKNKERRYGTYVNEQLLQPEAMQAIHAGDIVRFGKYRFRVEDF